MARKKTSGVHTVKTTNTAAQKIEAAKAVVEEKAAEVKEAVKETAEKVEEAAKETVEKATETVAEVKEIMDEAISHSQKANVKHLARRVFGKGTDDSDRIILKEEDFRI